MHWCASFYFLKKAIYISKKVPLWQQIIERNCFQTVALLTTKNNKVRHNITRFVKYHYLCYFHKLGTFNLKYLTIQNTVPKYVLKRQNERTIQTASFLSLPSCWWSGFLTFSPKRPTFTLYVYTFTLDFKGRKSLQIPDLCFSATWIYIWNLTLTLYNLDKKKRSWLYYFYSHYHYNAH